MERICEYFRMVRQMIKKELLATLKDPRTRGILVLPIIVQSLVFGYGATFNLEYVPYAVLDRDHSRASADFLAMLDGSGIFGCVRNLQNTSEIQECIDEGSALLVLTIEENFEAHIRGQEAGKVQVLADGRNSTTAAIANGYLGRILQSYNERVLGNSPAVRLESIVWYNPNLITRWSFMPGLIGLLSFVQVLLLAGLSVAREREQGTFDQLLVTPLSPSQILLGKAFVPWMIGVIQSTMILLICRFWFEVPMAGDAFPLYMVLFAFNLSCVGIGLSISAVADSMQQVMVYCFVLLMPMILLSGLVTPVSNMPETLQLLTYLDPLRFALDGLKRVYLEGAGFAEIGFNFVPMLLVAFGTLPMAAWLFRNKTV